MLEMCVEMQMSAFMCWNHTVTTYWVWWDNSRIPKFTRVPFVAHSDPHSSTHTPWKMCDISHARGGTDDSSVTGGWILNNRWHAALLKYIFMWRVWDIRWAYRLQQVCEVCEQEVEGKFKACYKLHSTDCVKVFEKMGNISIWYFYVGAVENQDFGAGLPPVDFHVFKNSAAAYFYTLSSFCCCTEALKQISLFSLACFTYVPQRIQRGDFPSVLS